GPYLLRLEIIKGSSQVIAEDVHTTAAYLHTDFEGLYARFVPPHSDEGIDLDGDTEYDYLRVRLEIQVNESGDYTISGDLWDKSQFNYITSATNHTYLNTGSVQVDLYFLGCDICQSGYGVYYFADVEIHLDDGTPADADEHQTGGYQSSDFDCEPPIVFSPPHSDYGLDTDADTYYNYLVADISIDASVAWTYRITGRLLDSSHVTFITLTENTTDLTVGSNILPLWLDGTDIYDSGIDGPYNLTLLSYDVYGNQLEKAYYDTNSYTYDQFQHEIIDNDPPTISSVTAVPDPQEVNGAVNVSALIQDPSGIMEAKLNVTDPDSGFVGSFAMNYDNPSGRYFYSRTYDKVGTYDFLIFARDTAGNWATSSGQFTTQDTTDPTISDVQASPNPQEVNGNVKVSAVVTDNHQLSQVRIEITDPDGLPVGNFSMSYDGGTGRYYYENAYPKIGFYDFIICAEDMSGNWACSWGQFQMRDTTAPSISSVTAIPNPQEVFGSVNVSAVVSDNYQLDGVWVEIIDPDALLFGNFSMPYDSGTGRYYYQDSYSKLGSFTCTIRAKDTSNNWNSAPCSFLMQDSTYPTIQNVLSFPDPQTVDGFVNVSAQVSDNYQLNQVLIRVKDPSLAVVYDGPMDLDIPSGKYYRYDSYHMIGDFSFNISASDSSGNWAYYEGTFTIVAAPDVTPPNISDVTAVPNPQEIGGSVNVSALVTDDAAVAGVWVEIRDPSNNPLGNFSMSYDIGSGRYYYESAYGDLGVHTFTIRAKDTSNNWNSASSSFLMEDTTPPTIQNVLASPDPQTVGGFVNITAGVSDNYDLSQVLIVVTDPSLAIVYTGPMNFDVPSGKYYHEDSCTIIGDYSFNISASDGSGNWAYYEGSFTIVDTPDVTPPNISDVTAVPDPQEVGGTVNISAIVTDDKGVSGVWVEVLDPSNNPLGNFSMSYDIGSGRYFYESTYLDLGTHSFVIWANDASNNWNSASGSFVVEDTTPPVVDQLQALPNPQEVSLSVNISAAVTDNVQVLQVTVEVRDPTMATVGNFTMAYDTGSGRYFKDFAGDLIGTYTFTIWASDTSGNFASSTSSFTLEDWTSPTISQATANPDPQEASGSVNITAQVDDNYALSGVWVVVSDPFGTPIGNFTMSFDSGSGKYYYEDAYTLLGTWSYVISASDTSNNWNSVAGTFVIQDTTQPSIDFVSAIPDPQIIDGFVNVSALVSDNYALSIVSINITDPLGWVVYDGPMDFDPVSGRHYRYDSYHQLGNFTFVIRAEDSDGNFATFSGKFSIEQDPNDTVEPSILSLQEVPDPRAVYLSVNISAVVIDNWAVDSVWVLINDPDMTPLGNFTMVFDVSSGRYYYESTYSMIGQYTYTLWANDTSGNKNSASGSFLMLDITSPQVQDVTTEPDPQVTGGFVNISAVVTDDYLLGEVRIVVRDPGGFTIVDQLMDYDSSSGRYYLNRTYTTLGTYTLTIAAKDTTMNTASQAGGFTIILGPDFVAPEIADVTAFPDPQDAGGTVNISALVTDDRELSGAWVEVYDPLSALLGNYSMDYDSASGRFYLTDVYNDLGPYQFVIWAVDASDNWNSASGSFLIVDTLPPAISDVRAEPDPQEVLWTVSISCLASDNHQLAGLSVQVFDPDSMLLGNYSMSYDVPTGRFFYELTPSLLGDYSFRIWASDVSGRFNYADGGFSVVDTTPPSIGQQKATPNPQAWGQVSAVSVVAGDNYELSGVWIQIWDPDNNYAGNFSMSFAAGEYRYDLLCSEVGNYWLKLSAGDSSGNWRSVSLTLVCEDKAPPEIDAQATPGVQEVHGTVKITASVVDNDFVTGVWVEVIDPDLVPLGNFSMNPCVEGYCFSTDFSDLGSYQFVVSAVDASGNWGTFQGGFLIVDTTLPIANAGPDMSIARGELAEFDASASADNHGIKSWTWTFNDGSGDVVLEGVVVTHSFGISGDFLVTLDVSDFAGNTATDQLWVHVGEWSSPKPPEDLAIAKRGYDFVMLSWTAPSQNIDGSPLEDLVGYHVYRAYEPGGPYVRLTSYPIEATTYNVTNLAEGSLAYYMVTAVNSQDRESDHSSELLAETLRKASVTGLVLDGSGAILTDVKVVLLDNQGATLQTAYTDVTGRYTFAGLKAGLYTVKASKEGYTGAQTTVNIDVGSSQAQAQDLVLKKSDEGLPWMFIILPLLVIVIAIIVILLVMRRRKRHGREKV
ncbi:MAG: carboxypeptidase regulatory-like domain-containing protein, partial [Candidatus Thermoplasmatota archaeon]|nr:carboxypeptidase regulatory-like domain-containing protein [Candidatus Thermoplasmatota archaeon]